MKKRRFAGSLVVLAIPVGAVAHIIWGYLSADHQTKSCSKFPTVEFTRAILPFYALDANFL